jgi:hypothetical protein
MIAPVSQARPIFVASGEGAGPAWMSVKAGEAGAFVFLPRGLPHAFSVSASRLLECSSC